MKKLLAFIIMAIFLASVVPVSLADNITDNYKLNIKDRLKNAQQRYVIAKQNYLDSKEKYLEQRINYVNVRQRVLNCSGDNSSDCIQVRLNATEQAKNYLIRMSDLIIESLQKTSARIDASEDLSDDEKAELIENLDERIVALEDAKEIVESSENNAEIIDAARIIKKEWISARPILKRAAGVVINARIGGIIVQSKRLEEKLDRIIEKLELKGYDITDAKSLVDDFSDKIESAKDNHEKAVEKFREAKEEVDAKVAHELLVDANILLKAAHQDLKDARVILKEVVAKIKEIDASTIEDEEE